MDNQAFAMIVNPKAGNKRGARIGGEVKARLEDAGKTVRAFTSTRHDEILTLTRGLNQKDWVGLIIVGGDGSIFQVLNGLTDGNADITIPIAPVPVGTGNSYARDIGILNPDDAIKAILGGQYRQVDLGSFTCGQSSYKFINLLGVGFVANVALRAQKYKFLGSKSYVLAIFEELLFLKAVPVTLKIDGKAIAREALFIEICNSRFTGGDMMMAPSAQIDDGILDIIVMNKTPRNKVIKLLPTIFTGKHVDNPEIEVFRGRNIVLESQRPMALNADGEVFGNTPISIAVEKNKVRFFVPPTEGN